MPLRDDRGRIVRFVGTCADIEELRVAQEALETSEERLRAVIDHSPGLIFLKDPSGRYILVNRSFEQAFDLDRGRIIGRTDPEVFAPEQAAVNMAYDLEVVQAGVPMEFDAMTPAPPTATPACIGCRAATSIRMPPARRQCA